MVRALIGRIETHFADGDVDGKDPRRRMYKKFLGPNTTWSVPSSTL